MDYSGEWGGGGKCANADKEINKKKISFFLYKFFLEPSESRKSWSGFEYASLCDHPRLYIIPTWLNLIFRIRLIKNNSA